jgi:hypothetical protein
MVKGGEKRKMKKQVVVILIALVVITTILTVSALSNEVGYKLSPCDAIDLSLENTAVTDFLNATNMATVQVSNFKGYKGENTWMVQWSSSDSLLDVYVNVATGNIAGIEEQKNPIHSVQASETPRWHPVIYLSSTTYTARSMAEEDGISYSDFTVSIFSVDGEKLSDFRCTAIECNKTQYLYRGGKKGTDTYYCNVTKACELDWWELLVEDYY